MAAVFQSVAKVATNFRQFLQSVAKEAQLKTNGTREKVSLLFIFFWDYKLGDLDLALWSSPATATTLSYPAALDRQGC